MSPHVHHIQDQPILDVKKLSVSFEGRFALEGLTFHLHAGERVAVVGPNGAGKSTLFKVIAGVLSPDQGEVKVYGTGPQGACLHRIRPAAQPGGLEFSRYGS